MNPTTTTKAQLWKEETDSMLIDYDSDRGYVFIKIKPGTFLEAFDVSQLYDVMEKRFPESTVPVVTDISEMKGNSREARSYPETCGRKPHGKVAAIVTNNAVTALMGNFYMKLNKPRQLTRLFSSERKAAEWIDQLNES